MGVFGDTLRQARAHKGVTLREVETATRINRHWLLALEEEHFDQLPAPIYQRGIVRNYATYLNLDQAKLLQLFADVRGDNPADELAILAQPTTLATAGSFVPNFAVIAFIVVAMGAIFAWGYSAYFAAPTGSESGGGAIPTATALNDEDRFIATNTPAPPTETQVTIVGATEPPSAEVDSVDTSGSSGRGTLSYPTATAAANMQPIGDDDSIDEAGEGTVDDGEVSTSVGEEQSFSFYATADVDLLIVVDNVIVWQQPLAQGQVTGYLTGSSFVVSISGAESIAVLDGDGGETIMDGPEFTLP